FLLSFPLSRHADHRDRHSFPTRRSSDLYVANDDEQGFIDELLAGQPDAPAYFGRMKRQNRDGPAILGHRDPLPELDAAAVRKDRSEEHTSELQSRFDLVCRLLLDKKKEK